MRRVAAIIAAAITAAVLTGPVATGSTRDGDTTPARATAVKTATKKKTAKKKKGRVVCRKRTVRSSSGKRRVVRVCRRTTRRRTLTTKPRPKSAATPAPAATTPTAPTAPAPTGASPTADGLRTAVRECANSERAKAGLPSLADSPALDRAADAHAQDMKNRGYFAHESPEGGTPWDRISAALHGEEPFVYMGENIAMGFPDVASTCAGWMASPGHRGNILNANYEFIGTAWVDGYAVQAFGGRTYNG